MRTFISSLIFLLLAASLSGQQATQFTQHMFNRYHYNPAYAGLEYSLSITAINRNQWSGLAGQPSTQELHAHMPFYLWNGALGVQLLNETLGAESRTKVSGSYNVVFDNYAGLFSLGVRLGVEQFRLDGNVLRTSGGIYEDGVVQHNDPILPSQSVNGISPTYSLGLYFLTNQFEGGLTIGNLPTQSVSTDGLEVEKSLYAHLILQYSYEWNDYLEIMPSIHVVSDSQEFQVNSALMFKYDKRYYFGGNVRGYSGKTLDAVSILLGMQISRHYRVTYAYDLGISDLRSFSDGSHEFILNYNLNKLIGAGLPPKIIYNPRY